MPTYEYECKACGHRLDAFQRVSDDDLVDCPHCEKPELTRLVSATAFQLKGSGWYQTDFKTSGKKEPAKANDSSAGDASAIPAASNSAASEKRPKHHAS